MTQKFFITLVALALTSLSLIPAQTKIVRKGEGSHTSVMPDDMIDLPELASIVAVQDGKLVVDKVFDKKMRPKENEPVDIQEGDVIMMVNGKRVKSPQELRDAYTAAAVGSLFKLGIQRNAEMVIASFEKADPAKLPKRRMVINRGGGEGHDVMIVPGTGLLVGSKGKEVVVEDILTEDSSTAKPTDAKKGDVVTAINEIKVNSFKDFSEAFGKLAVGATVTLHTSRKGQPLSFSFTKAEGGQRRIIKRGQD